MEFRVYGLGFRCQVLRRSRALGAWGVWFRLQMSSSQKVQGSLGFRVYGLGFRCQVLRRSRVLGV